MGYQRRVHGVVYFALVGSDDSEGFLIAGIYFGARLFCTDRSFP